MTPAPTKAQPPAHAPATPTESRAHPGPASPDGARRPHWSRRLLLPAAWTLSLAALTTAAFVLVLSPAWSEGERAAAAREVADARAQQLHEAEEETRRLTARAESLERAAASRGALRPSSDLNSRLSELAALAQRHGIAVTQLAPQAPTPRGRYLAIPIRITASANPDRAVAFIADLPGTRRDIVVLGLNIARNPNETLAGETGAGAGAGELILDLAWCAALPAGDAPPGTTEKPSRPATADASAADGR